jgi:hypothetical protein
MIGKRVQAGLDEPGGAADVGGDQVVEPGGRGVQVLAQALGLGVPQAEEGSGSSALIPARAARIWAARPTNWSIMSLW